MARYECKYYLSEKQYGQVMRWIEPYIQPDPFAVDCPGYRYMLSSLYLDSPDLCLSRNTVNGLRNRFKLRIRGYNDEPDSPIFFEIKRRIDGVIDKTRIKLRRQDGVKLLEGRLHPADVARGEELHNLDTFMNLLAGCRAVPQMRVRYEREAYEATLGEPVRLTFDRQLAYAPTREPNFNVYGPGWRMLNPEGIIFEVKFPDYYPFWVHEMIHGIELQRVPIAKYVMSTESVANQPPCWVDELVHEMDLPSLTVARRAAPDEAASQPDQEERILLEAII